MKTMKKTTKKMTVPKKGKVPKPKDKTPKFGGVDKGIGKKLGMFIKKAKGY